MLGSIIRVIKKYYPQTHLGKCKYEIKKNKMENLSNDDLSLDSSDESDNKSVNVSDNGSDNESDNDCDNDEN